MLVPYLEYLKLSEKPFSLTPDTDYYFESKTHKEALEHLQFFLGQREGIALIYGDVGTGKTTLSRIFLNSVDKSIYNTALILNPIMGEEQFIKQIMTELGIASENPSKKHLLDSLSDFLIEEHKKGRNTILVIDEAQVLSVRLLEMIRILSNIETEEEKILHTVMFAQNEFMDVLHKPEIKNLTQRITVAYKLGKFSEQETKAYINFRLYKAGSQGYVHFSDRSVKLIHESSQGCPRLINIICDRCLIALYSESKNIVDSMIAERVVNDKSIISLKKTGSDMKRKRKKTVAAGVAVFLFLCLVSALYFSATVHEFIVLAGNNILGTITAKTSNTLVKGTGSATVPLRSNPFFLIFAENGGMIVVCETSTSTIQIYQAVDQNVKLLKTFPCTVGKTHNSGKQDNGLFIPEGVFFLTKFIDGDKLGPGYGQGAYVLNFPSFVDFVAGRKDGQIWLHGRPENDKLPDGGEDNVLGIEVENESLREIRSLLGDNDTIPLVIVKKNHYIEAVAREKMLREIESFLSSLKSSLENLDTDSFLEHFAVGFRDSQGRNLRALARLREEMNRSKRLTRLDIQRQFILLSSEERNPIVVACYHLNIVSDYYFESTHRLLYIQKKLSQWKVIGEDFL